MFRIHPHVRPAAGTWMLTPPMVFVRDSVSPVSPLNNFVYTSCLGTNATSSQVVKLRNAMREYETDRWRIISTKVGNGFSPAACKEKAAEMAEEGGDDAVGVDEDEEELEQAPSEPPGSAMSEGPQAHLYR